ncbi:MAG TPA: hypothetical protein QF403_07200 [Alphaproteobacteria bacterium]|nr:hypothetical protein [Alphaproteobacteria bacterium]HJO89416.1 hypothetical protein [Alphaproteobacteria bacterium]
MYEKNKERSELNAMARIHIAMATPIPPGPKAMNGTASPAQTAAISLNKRGSVLSVGVKEECVMILWMDIQGESDLMHITGMVNMLCTDNLTTTPWKEKQERRFFL